MMTRFSLLAALLVLSSCSRQSPPPPVVPPAPPVAAAPVAPPSPPSETGGPAPTTPAAARSCSASTLSATPSAPKTALPPEVESMRRRILAAAVACDYDALVPLTREKGAEFSFGFGAEKDVAAAWREQEREGKPVLANLVKVLGLPHAQLENIYVWPSAYGAEPTDADWKALEGFYPPEHVAELRKREEGYVGFRVGIEAKGDWLFALSGD